MLYCGNINEWFRNTFVIVCSNAAVVMIQSLERFVPIVLVMDVLQNMHNVIAIISN